MITRHLIAPLGLLLGAGLLCQSADAENPRKKRAARKTARRLTGQPGPQRAAMKYQLKPERFKVKEPPPWVPNQARRIRRRPMAFGPQIYPEKYTADLGPRLVKPTRASSRVWAALPDLIVKDMVFAGKTIVRVKIANVGRVAAGKSVARLTVRRINGIAVGRMTYAKTPPIPANSFKWVSFNAKNILPNGVKLKATTFRVDADVNKAVAELKETNNRRWHNLSP